MPENRRHIFNRNAGFSITRKKSTTVAVVPTTPPPGADPNWKYAQPGAVTETEVVTLSGYAIRWNSLSDDRGGYKVRLLPGSAKFSNPTMALFHHNFAAVIGNTANNTLRITPDAVGVKVEIDLPNTNVAKDVAELVDKRYVDGMSFAMVEAPTFTMKEEEGQKIMEVSEFTADEVTVTAVPSFTDTSVQIAQEPAEAMEAAKKNNAPVTHRHAQGWHLQKMKLAAIGRVSMD